MTTKLPSSHNICDPNDWPQPGQCCGLGDCHICPEIEDEKPSLQNPSWSTLDYQKNGAKIDGEANAYADDRHLRDNHYNEI